MTNIDPRIDSNKTWKLGNQIAPEAGIYASLDDFRVANAGVDGALGEACAAYGVGTVWSGGKPYYCNGSKLINVITGNPASILGAQVTSVTNLVPTATDLTSRSFADTGALTVGNGFFLSNAAGISQIRESGMTLTAGKEYLAVFKARSVTQKAPTADGLYPDINMTLHDGTGFISGLDYQISFVFGENKALKPAFQYLLARFILPVNTSNGILYLRDAGNANMPYEGICDFFGLYDITGLSGVIVDSVYELALPLSTINLIGDSLTNQIKSRIKDSLGAARLNHNGQFNVQGSQTNGSTTIAIPTTNISTGFDISGTGLPTIQQLTVVDATSVTVPSGATRTLASNTYRVGFHGGGIKSGPIYSAWNSYLTNISPSDKSNTTVIWVGHNDAADAGAVATIKANILNIVSTLTGEYVVCTLLIGTNYTSGQISVVREVNKWILSYFVDRAVDVMIPLALGANGSIADRENLAKGFVPASLISDTIHINILGSDLVCDYIAKKLGLGGYIYG